MTGDFLWKSSGLGWLEREKAAVSAAAFFFFPNSSVAVSGDISGRLVVGKVLPDFGDGTVGGGDGSGHVARLGGAGFASAEGEVGLPGAGDPWGGGGHGVAAGWGLVVGGGGEGIGGPVFEVGGLGLEGFGAEEAGELGDAGLSQGGFAKGGAGGGGDAEEAEESGLAGGGGGVVDFPERAYEALGRSGEAGGAPEGVVIDGEEFGVGGHPGGGLLPAVERGGFDGRAEGELGEQARREGGEDVGGLEGLPGGV